MFVGKWVNRVSLSINRRNIITYTTIRGSYTTVTVFSNKIKVTFISPLVELATKKSNSRCCSITYLADAICYFLTQGELD